MVGNKNFNKMNMKMKVNKIFTITIILVLNIIAGCKNQDWEFPDFRYTTVYFAYQYPVKTLILGNDDVYDNSKDNEHVIQIYATMGGVYENKVDRIIDVEIVDSLCKNLKFESATGDTLMAMPPEYYELPSKMQIVIPKGKIMGCIEFKLKDAFFQDPNSIKRCYVIPLVMKSVKNADSILRGKPLVENPDRRIKDHWQILPKDYVLYAVKYINPYDAYYLRRGKNVVRGKDGNTSLDREYIYHAKYVEWNEVCKINTVALNVASLTLKTKADDGKTDVPFTLILDFNGNNCTITNVQGATNYVASGTGKYVEDADEWAGVKRDVLYLNYVVEFATTTHTFTDTLVMRDRGEKMELFNPFVLP